MSKQTKQKRRGFWASAYAALHRKGVVTTVYLVLRVLVILTLISQFLNGNFENVFFCVLSLVLFVMPTILERQLKIDLPNVLEIVILLFIFSAWILGEVQTYYTIFPYWDTILHTLNGFLCAAIGFSLVDLLNRHERVSLSMSPLFMAIVAFCFSMTVGVLWEFFECAMDQIFQQDMQKDTIVHAISSVMLDPTGSQRAQAISREIAQKHGVACMPINCLTLSEQDIKEIMKALLFEFPLSEMDFYLPPWVDALEMDHPIKSGIYTRIRETAANLHHVREVKAAMAAIGAGEQISASRLTGMDLGKGVATVELELPRQLFYETLSAQSGFHVADDGDLLSLMRSLAEVKKSYDKVSGALESVYETGYGIVMPTMDELILAEPEIMRQGGRYGVRLKANAPSIHMFKVDIESTVSPIVGNEKQSEDMVNYLMEKFEGDTGKIWESNIFGRSFHELVNEDLQAKLQRMPEDARKKFQETLQRIVNEGSGGLICIIL